MNTITVGIIFGGVSVEHDVSLWSAKNIMTACLDAGHDVALIYVKRDGSWNTSEEYGQIFLSRPSNELTKHMSAALSTSVSVIPGSGFATEGKSINIDIVFPIIHGTTGEDGVLQGCIEIAGIPYVGCGVTASAIGMDKVITKVLAENAGIPVAKYIVALKNEAPIFLDLVQKLGLPMFVKPASLGSSVGVSKVRDEEEYVQALRSAFLSDEKALIEEAIVGKEIECGILEDGGLLASGVGEVATTHEFYSYEAKYLDEKAVTITLPANIPEDIKAIVQQYSQTIAHAIGVCGLSRVDFFYSNKGEVIFNEINTLPGFTALSMYPMLWKQEGYSHIDLLNTLVRSALKK